MENKSAGECGWCGKKVPTAKHMKIQTGHGVEMFVCHPHVDKGCRTEWLASVRAAASKICDISGGLCQDIGSIVSRIRQSEGLPNQIAQLAYELCETIRKKADMLKELLGEKKFADLRKEFYFFVTNLLKHPREMAYI